jgi:hypothetical protein
MITGDRNFSKSTSKPPESPVSPVSPVPPKTHPVGRKGLTLSGVFEKGRVDYSPVSPETPVSQANPGLIPRRVFLDSGPAPVVSKTLQERSMLLF